MSDCIFCKIANGEIPSATVYEDDNFRALTKEEGKNVTFNIPACYLKGNELSIGPGSFIWYLNPEAYNKIVQDYEAFKKNGKK